MRKEVKINGKWYWELEQKNELQVFLEQPSAFFSDDNSSFYQGKLICCLGKGIAEEPPFVDDNGINYWHCALLFSEHEKKSRRCTDFELARWLAKGNGFWIDSKGKMRIRLDSVYSERNKTSVDGIASICTWDGEPMEPTAQNMGLEE